VIDSAKTVKKRSERSCFTARQLKTHTGTWKDKRDVRSWKGALGRKGVGRLSARRAPRICISTLRVLAVHDVRVAVAATNEAGLHASMWKGKCQGAEGIQVHRYLCLTQRTGQSSMEGEVKGSVKETAYSLRTSWGTSRRRVGLSNLRGREVGKGVWQSSRRMVCLSEGVSGLHRETNRGCFQRGHRTGKRVSWSELCLVCPEAEA
jgi:hypothetical protein